MRFALGAPLQRRDPCRRIRASGLDQGIDDFLRVTDQGGSQGRVQRANLHPDLILEALKLVERRTGIAAINRAQRGGKRGNECLLFCDVHLNDRNQPRDSLARGDDFHGNRLFALRQTIAHSKRDPVRAHGQNHYCDNSRRDWDSATVAEPGVLQRVTVRINGPRAVQHNRGIRTVH
jgi:hypothetical protein